MIIINDWGLWPKNTYDKPYSSILPTMCNSMHNLRLKIAHEFVFEINICLMGTQIQSNMVDVRLPVKKLNKQYVYWFSIL